MTSDGRNQPAARKHKPPAQGVSAFKATRRYLPHWQDPGSVYVLTWRTAQGLTLAPEDRTIAPNAIRYWDQQRWKIFAAVVMPDHVHVLAKPLQFTDKPDTVHDLSTILHSVKSYSAHEINRRNRRSGTVWQDERYDRIMRCDAEFEEKWEYIRYNPVKRELSRTPEEYPWFYQVTSDPAPHRRDAGATTMLLVFLLALLWGSFAWGAEPAITARGHWSFQPLHRPAPPGVKAYDWPRNSIDRFILAKLEAAGLQPAPEADRLAIIRRVTFDLTGLPPTPEEVEAFLRDEAPDAYDRLVDRLLASPAYGERQAQHWLDLARYAETDGFEFDHVRPNAWRYRDWVIDALNADMPYDDFVQLQIAGDELRPDDPAAAVATGFLLCGPDMPDINSQEERKHNFLNDMTATAGSVFLGLQFGCAQCHDHKYDPITQLDFYRLRAFFENAELFGEKPIPTPEQAAAVREFEIDRARRWKELEAQIAEVKSSALQRVRAERGDPDLRLSGEDLQTLFTADEANRHKELSAALERVKKEKPPELPMGRVLRERSATIPVSFLRIRGDYRRKGEPVRAEFPQFINDTSSEVPPPESGAETSGQRSALAPWMTRPDHPLTSRMIVNRLWQQHFGRGLVGTPSDFGTMGEEPTHPELLDWLATELPRRRWRLKDLHRLIVTSATYRQAGRIDGGEYRAAWETSREVDPDNRLLSHMPRRRLEGEALRDAMLAASDSLTQRRCGPGVRPPLPEELVGTLLKNQWNVTPDQRDHDRRSIYLFVRRNLQYPLFAVFDRPDTNASCPRRERSTIAPQALMLMNSELSVSAARDLCGYVLRHAGSDPADQVEFCYRRTLSRPPTDEERRIALDFLARQSEQLRTVDRSAGELALPDDLPEHADVYAAAALTDLCLALFNLNEFIYID